MADKSTLLRTFNAHFFEFLDDVVRIVPDPADIEVAKTAFMTIKRANPTAIIKVWFSHVYAPYSAVIDGGNLAFFIEKDYNAALGGLSNSNDIMKIVDKLRDPIRNMSAENQAHSLKYIQNLSKLSMLYNQA